MRKQTGNLPLYCKNVTMYTFLTISLLPSCCTQQNESEVMGFSVDISPWTYEPESALELSFRQRDDEAFSLYTRCKGDWDSFECDVGSAVFANTFTKNKLSLGFGVPPVSLREFDALELECRVFSGSVLVREQKQKCVVETDWGSCGNSATIGPFHCDGTILGK